MNKEIFSAYHLEAEVLMLQGCRMQVLGVEKVKFKMLGN